MKAWQIRERLCKKIIRGTENYSYETASSDYHLWCYTCLTKSQKPQKCKWYLLVRWQVKLTGLLSHCEFRTNVCFYRCIHTTGPLKFMGHHRKAFSVAALWIWSAALNKLKYLINFKNVRKYKKLETRHIMYTPWRLYKDCPLGNITDLMKKYFSLRICTILCLEDWPAAELLWKESNIPGFSLCKAICNFSSSKEKEWKEWMMRSGILQGEYSQLEN